MCQEVTKGTLSRGCKLIGFFSMYSIHQMKHSNLYGTHTYTCPLLECQIIYKLTNGNHKNFLFLYVINSNFEINLLNKCYLGKCMFE